MKVDKKALVAAKEAILVIGTKGRAFAQHGSIQPEQANGEKFTIAWPEVSLKDQQKLVRNALAAGRSAASVHPALSVMNARPNVSERGEAISAMGLSVSLKKGLVKKVTLVATSRDGKKSQQFTAYLPSTWKPGMKFGTATQTQFIATQDTVLGNKSGAVETRWVRDARNEATFALVSEVPVKKAK